MKIYIVNESGGEYEDEWDNILGAFTTLEKAQELRDRKKKENDDYVKYYITQITLDKEGREEVVEE